MTVFRRDTDAPLWRELYEHDEHADPYLTDWAVIAFLIVLLPFTLLAVVTVGAWRAFRYLWR